MPLATSRLRALRRVLRALGLALAVVFTPTSGAGESTADAIDYAGFLAHSREAALAREERLLDLDSFLALAAQPETILLDTRSAAAYQEQHLAGAVHLAFSDLTEESLRRVVGDPDRPVLIYCNNNFVDDVEPFASKAPAAALNVPTFATLWIYGYRNVYELGELLELSDPRLAFEGRLVDP